MIGMQSLDRNALTTISPAALSAYARAEGWEKAGTYRDTADVYRTEGKPDIIVPRTQEIDDYFRVVSQLLGIFAKVAERDLESIYRDLTAADRDVIRIRAVDYDNGSLPIDDGIALVVHAREMLLAAACSLREPQPLYRVGANKEANDFIDQVRLGQTEYDSFTITLQSPIIPPPLQPPLPTIAEVDDTPVERLITLRLARVLWAVRRATDSVHSGEEDAFGQSVQVGVSANLCEALAGSIDKASSIEVSLVWARTRPCYEFRHPVAFHSHDAPILRQAARLFRDSQPLYDVKLFGLVHRLKRDEDEVEGTVSLRTFVDDASRSVTAVLGQNDYERATVAHKDRAPVQFEGDLERTGQRWQLRNARLVSVVTDNEDDAVQA